MWNRLKHPKYTQILNCFCCRMWTNHAIGYGWILQNENKTPTFSFWRFFLLLTHFNLSYFYIKIVVESVLLLYPFIVLILNILWLFYSIKYGIDIGYAFMIIIEIDNIMGGNIILWTVECEREETCFYYYSWDFWRRKRRFLSTLQIYECEYWLHIWKTFAATQNI